VSTFDILSLLLIVFGGNYAYHKVKQLKLQVKKLETMLFFYIEYYGKERQEEGEKESKTGETEKG
jgi:hypothetical protein